MSTAPMQAVLVTGLIFVGLVQATIVTVSPECRACHIQRGQVFHLTGISLPCSDLWLL